MKKTSTIIFSLVLTLSLGFSLFAFTPVSAYGADISINTQSEWATKMPGGSTTLSNGDSLTIEPGAGSPLAATLVSIAANANVTIVGKGQTVNLLYFCENPGDTKEHTVTIKNLKTNTTSPIIALTGYKQYMGVLNLQGSNEFITDQYNGYYPIESGNGPLNITSSTNGTLSAQSGRGIPSNLSLQGNAELTSIIIPTTLNSGGLSSQEITIAQKAKLSTTGGTTGGISNSANILINNDGILTVNGGAGSNALRAGISGSIDIYMGSGAITNITNRGTPASSYDFHMISVGSGNWRLTGGATFVSGYVGSDYVKVNFPKDSMGTIALDHLVKFDANGGIFSDNSTIIERAVVAGSKIGSLPVPSRNGFTFMGYFTAQSGGSKITKDTVITSGKTFYARWASNNAFLKGLKVSRGKLKKKFAKTRYSYKLKLKKSTNSTKLTPSTENAKAKVQVQVGKKWKVVGKSYTTPKLKAGKSITVIFKVIAEDGKTNKIYKVRVSRAK